MENGDKEAVALLAEGRKAAENNDEVAALDNYRQALALFEKVGDKRGEALTLHQMGILAMQSDDGERAMDLFQRSLAIKDGLADLPGQANALANMAFVAFRAKDLEEAIRLNQDAIARLEQAQAWSDMVTIVNNHAFLDEASVHSARAQALWLGLRVPMDPEVMLNRCAEFVNELGPETEISRFVAAAAPIILMRNAGAEGADPQLRTKALLLIAACADAKDIPPEELNEWLVRENLMEPPRVMTTLNAGLEGMVGPGGWLFHPTAAPAAWWPGNLQ